MGTKNNAPVVTETPVAETPKELGPRAKFRLEPVILVATSNPKKNPSASYDRFQGYFDIDWAKPQTVGSVLDGRVVRMDDIRHDSDKGYIVIGADNIKAHEKAMEAAKKQAIKDAQALLKAEGVA